MSTRGIPLTMNSNQGAQAFTLAASPAAPISDLAPELQLMIFKCLDIIDILTLRQTCQALYGITPEFYDWHTQSTRKAQSSIA